jgi:hypothetical protein
VKHPPRENADAGKGSLAAKIASKWRVNAAAASAMMMRSLSCRFSPDAEKLAAPVLSSRPSI